MKQAGSLKVPDEHHASTSSFAPVPMFLPTQTFGRSVATVQTRQSFMNNNIGAWVRFRVMRFGSIALGIIALLLLPFNGIAAAIAGLAAGYVYGQYIWADFYVNNMLKSRRLLETT
jgi:hypothetical protein